jgi:hypothetical protein
VCVCVCEISNIVRQCGQFSLKTGRPKNFLIARGHLSGSYVGPYEIVNADVNYEQGSEQKDPEIFHPAMVVVHLPNAF